MKGSISIFILASASTFGDLILPSAGQELNYVHVLFEWEQEPDAEKYQIQVSQTESFDQILFTDSTTTTLFLDTSHIDWNGTYYWRIRQVNGNDNIGSWIEPSVFHTIEPKFQNVNVSIIQDELIQDGLTIFGGAFPTLQSGIIDKYGNEIWNDGDAQFMSTHVNEFGNIYGLSLIDSPNNNGIKTNQDMEILWSAMDEAVDFHEFKQIPNGNYMGFIRVDTLGPIPSNNTMTQQFQALGYAADDSTQEFPWYAQLLVEWNENHEIVWSWDPFDHFTMADFDNHGSTWSEAFFNLKYDWTHTNSFYFDENESVIYASHRHLSRITKIDYPSGDVIWNMGLPEPYMDSGAEQICPELLFSFQHHIQLLNNGHLIFFDNGNISDQLFGYDNPISRVLEVNVIGNSTCEVIWEYVMPPTLFGTGSGSVQALDNGHYLIYTPGNGLGDPESTIMEVTPSQEVVWNYVSQENESWYRAYRIPSLRPDAFGVIVDRYRSLELAGNSVRGVILSDEHPSFSFKIHNESGYGQPYKYILNDSLSWFNDTTGVVIIDSGDYFEFLMEPETGNNSINSITINIIPVHHSDAQKFFNFMVYKVDGLLQAQSPEFPDNFLLHKPYPNPFNPATSIRYDLPEDELVRITVLDLAGRVVKTLVHEKQNTGAHTIVWNAVNDYHNPVSAGIYFLSIEVDNSYETQKMMFLK